MAESHLAESRASCALLSPQQAAAYLGCSITTVRRWFYSGELKAIRLGAKLLKFRREDLDAFVNAGEGVEKAAAPSARTA